MGMSLTVSRHIDAAPSDVFEALTDLHRWPETVSAITKVEVLTDGPMNVGTRFRETRIMFKREATEEMEVVEFVPGRRYMTTAESHGSRYRSEVRVVPDGSGSTVEMEFRGEPVSFMSKVLSPVCGVLFGGALRKCVEGDLDDIKAFIEGQGVTVGT